jgi:hypothetical protein
MAVGHELPSAVPVRRKPHPANNIVQPCFKKLKQDLTGDTFFPLGAYKGAPELVLKQAVDLPDLLLLSELNAVVRKLAPALPVLSGRILPPLDSTFLCITSVPFEEQLFGFPATDPA